MTFWDLTLLFWLVSTVSGVAYAFGYAQGEKNARSKIRAAISTYLY